MTGQRAPMDLQTILTNAVNADRAERLKDSPQLTLGELILKLEAIPDKEKTLSFGFEYMGPTHFSSWRGSYNELALEFSESPHTKVSALLAEAKETIGKEFEGYKGGTYRMGKTTPIWVANYGNSGNTMLVNVREESYEVVLETAYGEY